jgi:hypothetical protein
MRPHMTINQLVIHGIYQQETQEKLHFRTLTPSILVRIQVPQPAITNAANSEDCGDRECPRCPRKCPKRCPMWREKKGPRKPD